MFFWYVAGSILIVSGVFRSHGVDYRLVAAGALLPLVLDAPWRRPAVGHTLLAAAVLLVVVMVATIGRPRLLRRRLLCLPIGMLCGLVLAGAWTDTHVLWWPTLGSGFPHRALLPAWGIVALEEVAGIAAVVWMVDRFRLREPVTRDAFLRTGRLDFAPRSVPPRRNAPRPGTPRPNAPRPNPSPGRPPRPGRRPPG